MSSTATTLLQTRTSRRRRSTQVAPAEPHALQRRASARFHPLSQSHVFGLVDLENEYPSQSLDRGGIPSGDVLHHGHHAALASTPKTQRLQLQGYALEGGWTVGPDGRATYVEHGRIEEVYDDDENNNDKNKNDDADNDTDDNDSEDDNDDDGMIDEHNSFFINPMNELQDFDMATPRLLSSLSHYSNLAGPLLRAETSGRGLNGFEITEPLPPSATPPPCPPRLRRIKPQLFPSTPSSAIGITMGPQQRSSLSQATPSLPHKSKPLLPPPSPVANGHAIPFRNTTNISAAASTSNSSMPPAKRSKAPPPPTATMSKTQQQQLPEKKMLDIATEVALLDENSDLLLTVFRDMRILHTLFFAQSPVENYTEHINCCTAIEEPVNRIIEVLNTRRRLGEEEWNVKTERWHQQYSQRLYSLRRTLIRLRNVRLTLERPLERRRMKPHHITLAVEKLKHHHAKLEDLAFKFVASFERLRVRHIHWLLVQAHTQARQRKEARKEDEASFEKAWYEDKGIREGLRNEFFEAQEHRTRLKQNRRL